VPANRVALLRKAYSAPPDIIARAVPLIA